ncbi:hypothetical protein QQ045_024833 [Rhodiola kirilowii]
MFVNITCYFRQQVTENGRFFPFAVHRRIAQECISKCWNATWASWRMIPESCKDIWFEEFQRISTWDAQYESVIRDNFMRRCEIIVTDHRRMRRTRRTGRNSLLSLSLPTNP